MGLDRLPLSRRAFARGALAAAAGASFAGVAARPAAAAYPDRPIKIVVPFAPGGPGDILSRMLSAPLGQALGQSVVVENRAGANGNLGIGVVQHSAPDGYTLLVVSSVFVANPAVNSKSNYDPVADFTPIVDIGASPNILAARTDTGIKNLPELIAYAKANPGKLNFSSPGAGSITQLGVELLKLQTGIDIVHVPYTGPVPAVQAALAGTVQLVGVNVSAALPFIKSGQLVGLVTSGTRRWPELPDVPTLRDAGLPAAESETYQSMFAPARTPPEIVARLSQEVLTILKQPGMEEHLLKIGLRLVADGPDVLRERVAKEAATWKKIVASSGIKVN
jgi:tripartite-type tricarboxylate transporter receptor subunit TctC